ncbi:MAG TPA: alanyl-tRNA editing protein [Candidatus Sulfotelmatobacter sp.]|nr:alanyl-tRNA editing protein [Candidatus Sulfotelmatobacter sp.]
MSTVPSYERDPYLRMLETEIIEAGVEGERPFVVLADTVLYPEGGGQPADRGRIGGVGVSDVRAVEGVVRHFVDRELQRGPVTVELDWDRRFDHMQHHTAQHLLTAVALDRFGWSTTAFHLGERLTDIELDTPAITPEQALRLEEAVATEIRAARSVAARRVTPEEYAALPVRSRGLPEGHRGPIRLVEIAELDLNTCGGTHLRSTAEIEAVVLLGTEGMRGGTRLRFAAGRRLRRLLATHEARAAQLRQLLGAADADLPTAVQLKLEQLKETQRQLRALEEDLAIEAARSLAGSPGRLVQAHWPGRDAAFLQRVARTFIGLAPERLGLFTAGGEGGFFLLCAGDAVRLDLQPLGRQVATLLGGRGGGSGRIFQGKASTFSRRPEALAAVEAALESCG